MTGAVAAISAHEKITREIERKRDRESYMNKWDWDMRSSASPAGGVDPAQPDHPGTAENQGSKKFWVSRRSPPGLMT